MTGTEGLFSGKVIYLTPGISDLYEDDDLKTMVYECRAVIVSSSKGFLCICEDTPVFTVDRDHKLVECTREITFGYTTVEVVGTKFEWYETALDALKAELADYEDRKEEQHAFSKRVIDHMHNYINKEQKK